MTEANTWIHPYKPDPKYNTKVAYFCMEFGIDQTLKIYSGGLGFLAGSHMRSAYELKQHMIGVGMLWKYGYYDQLRNDDNSLRVQFIEKNYSFLEDTGIMLKLRIHKNPEVCVKVFYLRPEVFGTIPIYLLSTDLPENDYLARTITHRLYDNNVHTRVAQSIVLGIGGGMLIDKLGGAETYHINEGHALPLVFHLLEKYKTEEEVRKHFVFTTHTPEKAGNEEHPVAFLNEMGFFKEKLSEKQLLKITYGEPDLNYTVTALRYAKVANAVSKLHGDVSRDMWKDYQGICPIISITNTQNKKYWMDQKLAEHLLKGEDELFTQRKKELKKRLFDEVANQTGKILDPNILTFVWARRFAGYKRPDLLLRFPEMFEELISPTSKYPVQIIWAGKPYPLDNGAIGIFNHLVNFTRNIPNCAILTGYELQLSKLLKTGTDIWLNTPRRPREASGTSGMTASMNAVVNFSIFDGWICEFVEHGKNGYVTPVVDETLSIEEQDTQDALNLYKILHEEILPTYYDKPAQWLEIAKRSMLDVVPQFESARMADEYYRLLYDADAKGFVRK
jgi:glycogen phosphorylase